MRIVVTAIGVAALFVCPPLFAQERSQRNGRRIVERFKQLDRNGDGKVTREEARGAPWFDRLDRDGDGVITLDEVQGRSHRPGGGPKAAQAATR